MPTPRPARARRAVWLVAAALVTTSACSGSHAAAPQAAARAAASSRAAEPLTPSASPSAGATKGGGTKGGSYLDATAKKSCKPDAFRTHAGLAGGALQAYVVRPHRAGTLKPRRAAVAADFAASELAAAAAAVKTCPPAVALTKVTTQASAVVAKTAVALRTGTDSGRRIKASDALYADVLAQAGRLRLTVRRTVPTPAQLAG